MVNRTTTCLLAPLAAALAALVLAGCGGEDKSELLPGDTARQIVLNLEAVKELADGGSCDEAQATAREVREQIDALGGVNKKLKDALRDGAARLNSTVAADCTPAVEVAPAVPSEATRPDEEESAPKKVKKEKKAEHEHPGKKPGSGKPKPNPHPEETAPAGNEPTTTTPQSDNEGGGPGKGPPDTGGGPPPPSGGVSPGSAAGGSGEGDEG